MRTRPRSPLSAFARNVLVRSLAFTAAAVLALRLVQAAVRAIPGLERSARNGLVSFLMIAASLGGYRLFVRLTEGRRADELSLRGFGAARGGFLPGFGLGTLLISAVAGLIALAGCYTVRGLGPLTAALPALAVMALPSVLEEIIFRGLFFRLVEEKIGSLLSALVFGSLFGLAHLANPGAGILSTLNAATAGILFCLLYSATRNLWFVIGFHLAWNLVQSAVFGLAVSGAEAGADILPGMLDATLSGPALVTGGAFGPEAGLPALFVLGLGLALTALSLARSGRLLPRPTATRARAGGRGEALPVESASRSEAS